jgi:exodeoxyribonuclease V beta subunit
MNGPLRYPRPPELARLGPGANVVEASAGTGKTFLLEHLFVDLVLRHGVPAAEILVVTFTEKATAELVLRLRRLLGELATLRPDHPKAVAAATAPPEAVWTLDEPAQKLLAQALLAFDRVGVCTIHAFCERVLREHAFVQGRLGDEELVGSETVFATAFADVLRTQVAADGGLAALLETWLASGKTVAELGGLLFDCDRARAPALRPQLDEARLRAALAAWRPVAEDDRALAPLLAKAKIRKDVAGRCCQHLAAISQAVAASAGDGLGFLRWWWAADRDHAGYVLAKLAGRTLEGALADTQARLDELRAAAVPLEAVIAQRLLPLVQERAARQKRTAGRFDFEDMLVLVDRALADSGPAGRALTAGLRARYRHALIDEFQDTDEVQWSIFRRVFAEAGAGHGLTIIGDPKQAIYGFRGANVETYLEAREDLVATGARRLDLERSFRATAALIEATNHVFEHAAGFFPAESGIAYDRPVRCGEPRLALTDAAGQPAAPVVLLGLETRGPRLHAGDARAGLASAIVRELRALLAANSPVRLHDGGGSRPPCPRDVFVLTFTNTESRDIGHALARARIPHAFYKQDKLFETTEAAEVLDVLRALCAPQDAGLHARALLTRFFALGLDQIALAGAAGGEAETVLAQLAAYARAGEIPRLFSALLEETGVLRRELYANASERALTNFMHVLELLQEHWARTGATLPELVERLAGFVRGTESPPGRDRDVQRLETDADAVQILTVHKAKGLEAGIVFLYGGSGERPPGAVTVTHQGGQRVAHVGPLDDAVKRRFQAERWSERCRVLYVAATRARFRLYLPHYPPQLTRLDGPYAPMNQRLDAIAMETLEAFPNPPALPRCRPSRDAPHASRAGGPRVLFERRPVDCDAAAELAASPPAAVATSADPDLLEIPSVPADVAAIRRARSGFVVTSYTAVKRARAALAPDDALVDLASPDEPPPRPVEDPEALPGGAATGIFLHELLARVSLGELAALPPLSEWRARPEVAELLEGQRRRAERPARDIEPAARLVHLAYTTPVELGGTAIPALAAVHPSLREMEFLYPLPERAHPLLSPLLRAEPRVDPPIAPAARARPWKIERGAVKGFIDFLFEHDGRVFVCDWKSDVLPSYAAAALDEHCYEHYDVQARLYTLAALRMCGIGERPAFARRFGGVVFVFLRGLGPGGQGIVHRAPAWDDVLAWQEEMLGQAFWGLSA